MGNLSIWYALNVSADTNIGLWGKPDILLLLFFHSKPFVAGTNLMTLVHFRLQSHISCYCSLRSQ